MERFWRPPRSLHFASLDSSSLAITLPPSIASHHLNSHPGFTSFPSFRSSISAPSSRLFRCHQVCLCIFHYDYAYYYYCYCPTSLSVSLSLPRPLSHSNVGDAYIGLFPTFLIRHTTSPQFYLRILVNLTSCCFLSFITFFHLGFINSSSFCSSISPSSTRSFRPLRCRQVSIYFYLLLRMPYLSLALSLSCALPLFPSTSFSLQCRRLII